MPKPSLKELLELYNDSLSEQIYISFPAKITKINSNYNIDAIPTIKPIDSKYNNIELPEIKDIPVFYFGSNEFRLEYEIKVNDIGLLIFSDYDLDNWLNSDGKTLVNSESKIQHTLEGAIFFPGLNPDYKKTDNSIKHSSDKGIEIVTNKDLFLKFSGRVELQNNNFKLLDTMSKTLEELNKYLEADSSDITTQITNWGQIAGILSPISGQAGQIVSSLTSKKTQIETIKLIIDQLKSLVDNAKL